MRTHTPAPSAPAECCTAAPQPAQPCSCMMPWGAPPVPLQAEDFSVWEFWTTPSLWRALRLGCALMAIQQLSGINTVMYYAGTIVVMAGFGSSTDPSQAIWMTALISFVGFAFTIVGVLGVERLGRRTLTLVSLAGIVVSIGWVGGGFYMSKVTSVATTYANTTGGECRHTSCYDCTMDSNCGFCPHSKYPDHPTADLAFGPYDGLAPAGRCVPGNATDPIARDVCESGYTYVRHRCRFAARVGLLLTQALHGLGDDQAQESYRHEL